MAGANCSFKPRRQFTRIYPSVESWRIDFLRPRRKNQINSFYLQQCQVSFQVPRIESQVLLGAELGRIHENTYC